MGMKLITIKKIKKMIQFPKGYSPEAVVDLLLALENFIAKQPEDELKQRMIEDLNEMRERVEEYL